MQTSVLDIHIFNGIAKIKSLLTTSPLATAIHNEISWNNCDIIITYSVCYVANAWMDNVIVRGCRLNYYYYYTNEILHDISKVSLLLRAKANNISVAHLSYLKYACKLFQPTHALRTQLLFFRQLTIFQINITIWSPYDRHWTIYLLFMCTFYIYLYFENQSSERFFKLFFNGIFTNKWPMF